MNRYRITFDDGDCVICTTSSINQAIAGAVRRDKYDREIVKVEIEVFTHEEAIEQSNDLTRVLEINEQDARRNPHR